MLTIREEVKEKALEDYAKALRSFAPEELAWDFHCNVGDDLKRIIASEASVRCIDLCALLQCRRGGPFAPGWRYIRPICGGGCGNDAVPSDNARKI